VRSERGRSPLSYFLPLCHQLDGIPAQIYRSERGIKRVRLKTGCVQIILKKQKNEKNYQNKIRKKRLFEDAFLPQ